MIKAYLGTLVTFLAIDAIWLGIISRGMYNRWIGHLMRDEPLWPAAGGFYLMYIAGIVFLAVQPAMNDGSWKTAALYGAVLGFIAIVMATINVVGGFLVTNRMLAMFKKK